MPNARFYVRNHFETPSLDAADWRLAVGGLVERPMQLSLGELQNMRSQSTVATLECAGNGRSMFDPRVDGEQWHLGAVSTAEWTGVPLREVPIDSGGSGCLRVRLPWAIGWSSSLSAGHFVRARLVIGDARNSARSSIRDELRSTSRSTRLPASAHRARLVPVAS